MSFGMVDVFINNTSELTDEQIIESLKKVKGHQIVTGNAFSESNTYDYVTVAKIIEIYNRQKAEIDRLESVLLGVMHFVDKWLDGAELEQDEVNRASAMREKTLQIVEQQQAEIDRLNSCVKSEDEVRAIMKAQMETMVKEITNEQIDIANKLGRTSGILELTDRLEKMIFPYGMVNGGNYGINALSIKILIDKVRKEMAGDNNGNS